MRIGTNSVQMMKWLTKGTSTEVHTIGHHEVIYIQEKRRNDKYTRLHTIITFLCSFFFSLVNTKWSCSRGLFRFEHELVLHVGIWLWQTHRERQGPENREVVARHQSYFCKKFRSGPVTLEAAGVFHIAQRLGRPQYGQFHIEPPPSPPCLMLLSSPWISPTLFPSSLYPPTILLSPLAGKRSWSAMETEWLRRRPGRCTEDKFVCVSWAATLCSRTLTRSCQWEGKSRPSTSSAHLLPYCPPPFTPQSYCLHAWLPQQLSRGQRGGQAPWSQDFPLGSKTPALDTSTPLACTVEVPQTHLHTQSKLHQAHNRSPKITSPVPRKDNG